MTLNDEIDAIQAELKKRQDEVAGMTPSSPSLMFRAENDAQWKALRAIADHLDESR